MIINVKFFNYCQSQLSSTGVELREGEVLAPMFVQGYSTSSDTSGLIRSTFRQFRIMGISILIVFVPVLEEEYEQTVWWFNNSVNDYLKPYRKLGADAIEVTSWEELTEKRDYQTDDEGLEWFLLMEQFEFLKNKLSDSRYQTPLILEMLFEGYESKEIFEKFGVQKSAGYKKIANALAEGYDTYLELNQ